LAQGIKLCRAGPAGKWRTGEEAGGREPSGALAVGKLPVLAPARAWVRRPALRGGLAVAFVTRASDVAAVTTGG